jgi:hypothetical protein
MAHARDGQSTPPKTHQVIDFDVEPFLSTRIVNKHPLQHNFTGLPSEEPDLANSQLSPKAQQAVQETYDAVTNTEHNNHQRLVVCQGAELKCRLRLSYVKVTSSVRKQRVFPVYVRVKFHADIANFFITEDDAFLQLKKLEDYIRTRWDSAIPVTKVNYSRSNQRCYLEFKCNTHKLYRVVKRAIRNVL